MTAVAILPSASKQASSSRLPAVCALFCQSEMMRRSRSAAVSAGGGGCILPFHGEQPEPPAPFVGLDGRLRLGEGFGKLPVDHDRCIALHLFEQAHDVLPMRRDVIG